MKKKIDRAKLIQSCSGLWESVFSTLAPALSDAVGKIGSTKHSQCPFGERHSDSGGTNRFRLWNKRGADYRGGAICTCGSWSDGIDLIMDVNGWTFVDTCKEIDRVIGQPLDLDSSGVETKPRPLPKSVVENPKPKGRGNEEENKRLHKAIKRVWAESLLATSHEAAPMHRYLSARGISPVMLTKLHPDAIRFHPELPYYAHDGESFKLWGKFPAMLSLIQSPDGSGVTLHRTYLSFDGGKAAVPAGEGVKKLMAYPSTRKLDGGAIRLVDNNRRILAVAEGIETALSVYQCTKIPVWACYSADMLEKLDLNLDIDLLLIFADKDRSLTGELAAKALKQRAWSEGIRAQILLPPAAIPDGEKGVDWNDIHVRLGVRGFPSIKQMMGSAN